MSGGVPGDRLVRWLPGILQRDRMLKAIGVQHVLDLYRDVPDKLLLHEPPLVGYGEPLSEEELRRIALSLHQRDRVYRSPPPFTGGGWCPHLVPAVIDCLVSRGEFLTAYTPYQPEINQGLLQAMFEYQSLIADLVELEIVNASLYDGSTAVAEAALMALRVTRRKRIVVSEGLHPEYLEVLRTWLYGKDVDIRVARLDAEAGTTQLDSLEKLVDGDTAAVIIASPNFFGAIEDVEAAVDRAHSHGALLVHVFEPLSLGLLPPPGRFGADIAVAEGQPLGLGLNYGGPGLGVFAARWDRKLIRQMPGRIIGLTRDAEGRRAFTMILQAREQHIRREKATSNITTNEALMAVRAAIYLSLLGGQGLRRLARSIWLRSHYLARRLSEEGVEAPAYTSEFFKEFTARFPAEYGPLYEKLAREGLLAGLPLARYYPQRRRDALFCATELHSRRDIDLLVEKISETLQTMQR
jgi:glycine dehydrogenase subunit 1